jgi:hypothetical protein
MPWAVTLHVTSCDTSANLAGAWITDGSVTYYTDSNGQFIAIINDAYHTYIVNIGKSGYVSKNFAMNRAQHEGTIQNVCLETYVPPETTGNGPDCFIVSATTGSEVSAENVRLMALRDRVMRATAIGTELLDAIYRDYYSFSPAIAAELAEDDELRDQVLRTCVRPLLAWYGLIEVMVLDAQDRRATERAARSVLGACLTETPAVATTTAALLDTIRRGDALPDDAAEPFRYLVSQLAGAVELPFAAWSIFDPIVRAWRCAATGSDVIEEARAWLADAPLERLDPPAGGEPLRAELMLIAGPLGSSARREEVGVRLASAWPHLADDLRRSGLGARGGSS